MFVVEEFEATLVPPALELEAPDEAELGPLERRIFVLQIYNEASKITENSVLYSSPAAILKIIFELLSGIYYFRLTPGKYTRDGSDRGEHLPNVHLYSDCKVIVISDDRLNERGKYDLRSGFIHIWYLPLPRKPYSDHLLAKVRPKRLDICGKIWYKYEVSRLNIKIPGHSRAQSCFSNSICLLNSGLIFFFQDCLWGTSCCCCNCGFARCSVMSRYSK